MKRDQVKPVPKKDTLSEKIVAAPDWSDLSQTPRAMLEDR